MTQNAHVKTSVGSCSACGATPSEVAEFEVCSDLARALHGRGRPSRVFQVEDHFGLINLAGKRTSTLAMQILSIGEEGEAVDAAHKTRSEHSKRAGDGRDDARRDPGAFEREQNIEALMRACRMVDEKGQPTQWAAFPGVSWVRRELSTDQIACLLALYDELKRKHGTVKLDIDADTVGVIAKLLQEHVGDDIPESFLAPYPRWFLTHLAVLLSVDLGQAKKSVDLLLEARDAWQLEREALEAKVAALQAQVDGAGGSSVAES